MTELQKLNLSSTSTPDAPPVEKPVITTIYNDPASKSMPKIIPIFLAIVLGAASGFGLYKLLPGNPSTTGVSAGGQLTAGIKVGDIIGNADEKTFRDHAEGVIDKGTTSGEGSHSLLREGGPSKTANLTSSVIDLDQFVGHKVEVWGETFSAQKSGWLMDVGRIKVLELNAPKPQ
jgi:hypothetical protein